MGIIILSPVFVVIWVAIKTTSAGSALFVQTRVGRHNKDFPLYKFRSMRINSESKGQLTVGSKDSRITTVGYYLRMFKLDELPQLFNVFIGHMSLVGPRPEVRKYVNYYSAEQLKVLTVKPGITDYASIKFINENELLAKAANPEDYYISEIMPQKLAYNLMYIKKATLFYDVSLILNTLFKIVIK